MPSTIVIVGAGPAGCLCARQLARNGHRVTLVDRSRSPAPRLGETCGARLRRLLESTCDLSLPPSIYCTLPYFFSAWGSEQVEGRNLIFWQAGNGLVLDREAFDQWLLNAAKAAGVEVLGTCNLVNGQWEENYWKLNVMIDGINLTLNADFVVDATGRSSRSLLYSDVRRFFTDDLVCLSVELPMGAFDYPGAIIESCMWGWWYSVALISGCRLIALFTDADLVASPESRLTWFRNALNTSIHVRRLVDQLSSETTIRVRDARSSVRSVLWRQGWLSIGDAAWALDPLSGNGIERAVTDGIDAAAVISRAIVHRNSEGLRAHAISRASSFQQALITQSQYYQLETRWKNSLFWCRRN